MNTTYKTNLFLGITLFLFAFAFGQEPPFTFTKHLLAESIGARSVVAADIDGNGVLDVFSASTEDNSIRWFENKNEEGFTDYTIFAHAKGAYSVTTADIDGDTDIDVLSASSADNTIRWYENKGVDGFTCIDAIFRNAESASSVITANMDGDEDIDVLSASYSDNSILWYENDGTGKFTNEQGDYMVHIIDSNAGGARAVAVADMDGDMDIDVLSASYNDAIIRWYENKGAEGFVAYTIDDNAPGANSIAAADFDNDGNMDVVAGIYNAAEIRWYENNKEALNMQRVLPQSIALHPNPMTNVLHISYISTTTVNYTLYDSTGKQLSSQTHTGKEHQLEVWHLASGTYLLKANNDTQFKYYRFMKE